MIKTPLLFLSAALPISAATLTLQSGVNGYDHLAQDFRGSGTTNNGGQMLVGYQSAGVLQIRSVLGFGLSSLPAGAVINSISLTLVSHGMQSGTVAGVGAVELHEVIPNNVAANNMVEGQVTSTTWRTGSTWTNTLGDFSTTTLSTATLNNTVSPTTLDLGETAVFGSSSSFVAAAQAAFDAGLPLELMLIAPLAESTTGSSNFFRFESDDFATVADRPLLTIDYTIPEPSAAILAASAGLVLLGRRRR